MNGADWIIVTILSLSSIIGLIRGFFKEAFSLMTWLAAVIIANLFSERCEQFLAHIIATPSLRAMTAFVGIFALVLLAGMLISYGINLLVKASGLSVANRICGMCFGFFRGFFIVMILLIYLPAFIPVKNDPWFQQSLVIPYVAPFKLAVKNVTSEIVHGLLNFMAKSSATKT
jgi:membrane protein required for colicin V production